MAMTLEQQRALMRHVDAVREFHESESVKHVVAMLEITRAALLADLADVKPEALLFTQGALKQTDALLRSLTGPPGYVPKAAPNT